MAKDTVITVENLSKTFMVGGTPVRALKNVSFEILPKSFAIIYGPSGCGKSTLLHTIVGLEPPTTGKVYFRGHDIYQLDDDERAEFRARHLGMLYQQSLWVAALPISENIALPLIALGEPSKTALHRANHVLEELGLEEFALRKPAELSGGEQQKIGLARALINNPWLLVLDEPTGNLDTHSADELMQVLQRFHHHSKRTIVLVTHNLLYLPFATQQIYLKDGQVVDSKMVQQELSKVPVR
ncbi:MAG: hypothetical protein COS97_02045 [Candidatus Nealsonbacteria bacterium CG07_land_8_20_14_0_80_40_10]|nr:MAG: hypothetical protein COU44_00240 [Candidatus Nealsonbacteria bacterium CG10_big_fil_rev_8_21_14_0_10_40_24]PIU43253.1 MAG: hypothetical protein COS97_02045 [Candidatus Nealsonbacteria bacterium CG07_land_8_20_14_0_80_40_10]